MQRRSLILFFCLAILFSPGTPAWSFDFLYHSDGPYKGKVIDADTGEPIEGAVVAGVWGLEFGFMNPFCDAKEVLTDKKGEFILPRASCFDPSPLAGVGGSIVVFKPGYLGYPPLGPSPEEREARWPGFSSQEFFRDKKQYNIIRLGRPRTWVDRRNTWSDAGAPFVFDECLKKLPILLKLVNEEERSLGLGEYGK